jgi:hypothetical protein
MHRTTRPVVGTRDKTAMLGRFVGGFRVHWLFAF